MKYPVKHLSKYIVTAVLLAPLALIVFLGGSYYWDRYQAGLVMRANVESIAVGDSLTDVEAVVDAAQASAVNHPYGSYLLAEAHLLLPEAELDDSRLVIRGFWLRTGITCYSELVVEQNIVSEVGDVYCENDGWLE